MIDTLQTVVGAPHQHFMAVIEEGRQTLAQIHHAWRVRGIKHVHVQADADFQVGVAEHLFHQHLGLDGAVSGFQHDTHVGRRFVADVGEQRQRAERQERCRLLNQARLLDVIGYLAHYDLVLTATQLFDLPSGA